MVLILGRHFSACFASLDQTSFQVFLEQQASLCVLLWLLLDTGPMLFMPRNLTLKVNIASRAT